MYPCHMIHVPGPSEKMSASSQESKLKVAVVGAGVIGLSAALHLTERFPGLLDMTVIADRFTPDTASDKSSAMVKPVDFYSGPRHVKLCSDK